MDECPRTDGGRGGRDARGLEAVDLNVLGIQAQTFLLICQELLNIFALITLELNHFAHFRVVDNGAIASEFLLYHFQDLLLIKFFRQTLHRSQGLTTIALLDTDMYVILRRLGFATLFVGLGERVESLEVFDGHKITVCQNYLW